MPQTITMHDGNNTSGRMDESDQTTSGDTNIAPSSQAGGPGPVTTTAVLIAENSGADGVIIHVGTECVPGEEGSGTGEGGSTSGSESSRANATTAAPITDANTTEGGLDSSVDGNLQRRYLAGQRLRRTACHLQTMHGRLKELQSRHGQWTCFICCHVRTGTIIIGFWHMLLHLMALSLIAVVMVHPDLLSSQAAVPPGGKMMGGTGTWDDQLMAVGPQDVQAVNCTRMPCSLATQNVAKLNDAAPDFPLALGNLLSTHRLNSEDINVALFITMCTFMVTLLLVYGAFRGQPSHLMPFFFLQVFDFCISSMTMIGYLSYLPNVRQLVRETPTFPFQQNLLAMNTKCLTFFVMLIFISTFMVKGYCISIVWRCYKYLVSCDESGRWIMRHLGTAGAPSPVHQESQTLVLGHDLPDYDTAIADSQYRKKLSGLFPEPPPSYDMAMAALYSTDEPGQATAPSRQTGSSADVAPLLHSRSHSAGGAIPRTPVNF